MTIIVTYYVKGASGNVKEVFAIEKQGNSEVFLEGHSAVQSCTAFFKNIRYSAIPHSRTTTLITRHLLHDGLYRSSYTQQYTLFRS